MGYSPTCHCMPSIERLEKHVSDANDNVYERMQSTNQALTDRIEQVDHRSSMRVHALEQYTRERFTEEENMCRNRITQRMESGVYTQQDNMKQQIQDWLEQRLEDYGHCLNHHHDDSALPSENIFTHIQETANGRLFKSRSDETLSQSDNHSGHFRKKDFYESRQAAMQQIRAWQVPQYSRDRNKVRIQQKHSQNSLVHREQHNQRQKWQQEHSSQQNVYNSQQNVHNSQQSVHTVHQRTPHLPVEAKVEIRNSANRTPNPHKTPDPQLLNGASAQNIPHTQSSEDSNYMTMSGFETQGAIPKHVSQSQSSQNVRERRGSSSRGPVTHSTPKSHESSPFEYSGTVVRSHTDSGISRRTGESSNARKQIFAENEQDSRLTPTMKQTDSFKQSDINLGSSQNSDKLQSSLRKPTFTTFGYDESAKDGMTAPANSPEQNVNANPVYKTHGDVLPARNGSYSSPHSNSGANFTPDSAHNQLNSHSRPCSRQESMASYGFEPSHKDDLHVNSSSNQFPALEQKTRSTEGLLTDSSFTSNSAKARLFSRSQSEDRFLESDISHNAYSPRSSSESRGLVNSSVLSGSSAKSSQSSSSKPPVPQSMSYSRRASTPAQPAYNQSNTYGRRASTPLDVERNASSQTWAGNHSNPSYIGNNSNKTDYPYVTMHEIPRGGIANSIHRNHNHSPVNMNSDAKYTSVRDMKLQKDSNHNITVKADIHNVDRNVYYSHESLSGQLAGLEPRSPTSYQTYLTGPELHSSGEHLRQSSPNVCNNSKEDSSSNPDSGYSSKIYGARVGAVIPASSNSTPSSSFSTDRGISTPSNATNSPHSTYSNPDYQQLPASHQYEDEVQTHVQSWYKRKLQEATERCYDNWKAGNSPRKLRQNGSENTNRVNYGNDNYAEIQNPTSYQTRLYGDDDYAKIPQTNGPNFHGRNYGNDDYAQISQFSRQNQYGGQYNGQQYVNGYGHHSNGSHLISTYTRGSDV